MYARSVKGSVSEYDSQVRVRLPHEIDFISTAAEMEATGFRAGNLRGDPVYWSGQFK